MHDPMNVLGFLYWDVVMYANLTNQTMATVIHEKKSGVQCVFNTDKLHFIESH